MQLLTANNKLGHGQYK